MLMNRNIFANLLQKLTESDVNEQKYICQSTTKINRK